MGTDCGIAIYTKDKKFRTSFLDRARVFNNNCFNREIIEVGGKVSSRYTMKFKKDFILMIADSLKEKVEWVDEDTSDINYIIHWYKQALTIVSKYDNETQFSFFTDSSDYELENFKLID